MIHGLHQKIDLRHVDVTEWLGERILSATGFAKDPEDQDAGVPHRGVFANDSIFSAPAGYALRDSIIGVINHEANAVAAALKNGPPNEHLYVVVNPMGRGGKWGYAYPFLKAALERRFGGQDNVTVQLSGWDSSRNEPVYDHVITGIQQKIDADPSKVVRVRSVGGDGLIGETLTAFLGKSDGKVLWDCPSLIAEFSDGGTAGDLPKDIDAPAPHNTGTASAKTVPFHMPKVTMTWCDENGSNIETKTQVVPHTLVGGVGARLFRAAEHLAAIEYQIKKWDISVKPFALLKKFSKPTGVGYQVINIAPVAISAQSGVDQVNLTLEITGPDKARKFYYSGRALGALVACTPEVAGVATMPHTDPVGAGTFDVVIMPSEADGVLGRTTLRALAEVPKPRVAWRRFAERLGGKPHNFHNLSDRHRATASLGDTVKIAYDKPVPVAIDGTGQVRYATAMTVELGALTPLQVRATPGSIFTKLAENKLGVGNVLETQTIIPEANTILNPDSMLHHLTPGRFKVLEWFDAKAPVNDTEGRATRFAAEKLHEQPLTGKHAGLDYFGMGTIAASALGGVYGGTVGDWSTDEYVQFMENMSGLSTKAAGVIALASGSSALKFYSSALNYGPAFLAMRGATGLALDGVYDAMGWEDSNFKHFLHESIPVLGIMGLQMAGKSTAMTQFLPFLASPVAKLASSAAIGKLGTLSNYAFVASLAYDAGEYAYDAWNGTHHGQVAAA